MRLLTSCEHIPLIPELVKLMQEDSELEASLNHTVRCYLSWWDIKSVSNMRDLRIREENEDSHKIQSRTALVCELHGPCEGM